MTTDHLTTSTPSTAGQPRTRTRRPPTFSTDDRGNPVVLIELGGNAGTATVDREDFDRLVGMGVSLNWVLGRTGTTSTRKPSVRVRHGGNCTAVVARLILDAPDTSQVRYASSDRLNLTRRNIRLVETLARGESGRVIGVNRAAWQSIAGTMTRTAPVPGAVPTMRARIAAERVEAEAAERAAVAAGSIRVARIKAEIEAKVAAGADRDAVTAEGMAQARAERIAYAIEHGLDPATGRHPRPLYRAQRNSAKERKAAAAAAPADLVRPEPTSVSPEVIAALPFKVDAGR